MKNWQILNKRSLEPNLPNYDQIVKILLVNRNIVTKSDIHNFLHPRDPVLMTPKDVGIDTKSLTKALKRIEEAIRKNESIVVYADYDADGITAGAIMWETIHALGGNVMPYIPHRVEEGYGLSMKGIDNVKEQYNPTLIITVDHGITAREKVAYARETGIDVIITDHHVQPKTLPECIIVHTINLSGAGVSWFLAKELLRNFKLEFRNPDLLVLATIGTIADMVPLVGPNRSIAKYGLDALNHTTRVGLDALIAEAGLVLGNLGTYDVSHILAPRLNAMGRIEHALDALRLICTSQKAKAESLARKLDMTNRERQQLTLDTTTHALQSLLRAPQGTALQKQGSALRNKLIFISHQSYNQGVIGLVAGKLVEEYYRPAIVVAVGEVYSKASARSINGFNIVEAIRSCSDILVDVGGHPMAAGFTVETKHLSDLKDRLEAIAQKELDEEKLTRTQKIDMVIPLEVVSYALWEKLRDFEPFGFGNPEPVFATKNVRVFEARLVGSEGKHLKLRLATADNLAIQQYNNNIVEAIGFGMGNQYGKLQADTFIDIAYTISVDTWNSGKRLQLKIKDIHTA